MKRISKKRIIDYINEHSNYLLPHNANTEMAELGAQAQLEDCERQLKEDGYIEITPEEAMWVINNLKIAVGNRELTSMDNKVIAKLKPMVEMKEEKLLKDEAYLRLSKLVHYSHDR